MGVASSHGSLSARRYTLYINRVEGMFFTNKRKFIIQKLADIKIKHYLCTAFERKCRGKRYRLEVWVSG